jgi:hypothetical protein
MSARGHSGGWLSGCTPLLLMSPRCQGGWLSGCKPLLLIAASMSGSTAHADARAAVDAGSLAICDRARQGHRRSGLLEICRFGAMACQNSRVAASLDPSVEDRAVLERARWIGVSAGDP